MNKTIYFNTDEILPALSMANSVIPPKPTIAILNDVCIETKDDGNGGVYALLTTSDSETWLQIKARLDSLTETGIKICVEGKALLQALRNLSGQQVSMEVCEGNHIVFCKYANGHFKLPYEDTDMFPMPKEIVDDATTKIRLDAKKVLVGIEKAGYATANDELRPVMNGVHIDFLSDGMVFVATDGLKLAKYKDLTITYEKESDESISGFTLPKKPCNTLMNVLANIEDGDILVQFNSHSVIVNNTMFKMTSRLIEGRFPNYNSVIPQESEKVITLSKASFISALKRVSPMYNVNSELVVLKFENNGVTISAENIDFNKAAAETIPCDYTQETFEIGFKGSTLLQVLQSISGDSIKFLLNDPRRAGVIRESEDNQVYDYTSLVMPMLING